MSSINSNSNSQKGVSDGKTTASSSKAAKQSKVFADLQKELELTGRIRNESGQLVKRHPRHLRPELTKKRKAREKEDQDEMAMEVDEFSDDERKRLRGSKIAFEDVVLNSMPLSEGGGVSSATKTGDQRSESKSTDSDGEDEEEIVDDEDVLKNVASLGIEIESDFEEIANAREDGEEDCDSGDDNDEEDPETVEQTNEAKAACAAPTPPTDFDYLGPHMSKNKTRGPKPKRVYKKRLIYRLRDFTSHRLSLRHGEALGAHVRGDSETAVQKLREVAKAAPGAPQVYSSLGMVYESMLEELEKGMQSDKGQLEMSFQYKRLEVAQKAYASLHIASVLCRKDFVLWERSGDVAMKMVQIYDDIIDNGSDYVIDKDSQLPAIVGDPMKWRTERTQSLEHALNAYLSSDNLRPPGVDIPCKLARVNMKLGKLIEALSILTDLRNRGGQGMEGSYPCWLLYADLMMMIGFECTRWNNGTCTSHSYMLKRWLRKHSKTFDWKERRLQALCLALEAAAGSKAAAGMKQRMKERTKQLFVNEQIEKEDGQDQNVEIETTVEADSNTTTLDSNGKIPRTQDKDERQGTGATHSLPAAAKSTTYEDERCNLVKRNELEMQKFDMKTKSMNPVEGSHIHKARMSARAALVEKHRDSVRELARRRFSDAMQKSTTPRESQNTPDEGTSDLPLPLQASCSTVCEIAALLLTQCVQMALKSGQSCRDLYQDGLVVAQSVLSYYTERINRHTQKMEKQERYRTKIESNQGLQPSFDHDDMNFESDEESDADDDIYISDDDDLNQPEYLSTLQKGFLPVNIRALYSLCLIGAGGQDFLALSYIEKVMSSDELDLFESGNEDEFNHDAPWILFEKQFNMAINKTSFLALVADMTKAKASRNTRMSVARMLRSHIKKVDAEHGLDEVIASNDELLRTNMLKILFAETKLMLESAELAFESLTESDKSDSESMGRVVNEGLSALDNLIRFQHVLWYPTHSSDWSLPSTSLETLDILSAAMSLLSHALYTLQEESCNDILKSTLLKSRSIIAMISNTANDALEGVYDSLQVGYDEDSDQWTAFPLPCIWETVFQKNISRLAYNLCVANCVSSFSGWAPEEFNIDALHHNREDINIFGISLDGASVAGFLSTDAAASVSRQWDSVRLILPNLEPLRYDSLLSQRMDTEWYQRVTRHSSRTKSSIASFKEDGALMALLSFSTVCLFATKHSDLGEKDELVKLAMSVLLPVTQFSVDKDVWQSRIGTKAISETNGRSIGYYVDENSQWMGPTKNGKVTPQSILTKSNEQSKKAPSRTRITPRFRHHSTNKISVQVPTAIMLSEWNRDELQTLGMDPSEDARHAMTTLDNSMKNLRKSRTLQALERSSLDVAVALIEVASHQECYNPFLCLQQAAIFAAMGPKQGNNDEPFKKFLPLQKKCTELNALVILGRADCLRAIHFLDSAQFLCSWVANICRIHRDGADEHSWSSRWSVISALLAYISDHVNDTAKDLGKQLPEWGEEVKEVLAQGKNDASLLLNSRQLTHKAAEPHAWNETEEALATEEEGEADDDDNDYSGYYDMNNVPQYDQIAAEHTGKTHVGENDYSGCDGNIDMTGNHLLHHAVHEPVSEQDDNLFGGMNWAPV